MKPSVAPSSRSAAERAKTCRARGMGAILFSLKTTPFDQLMCPRSHTRHCFAFLCEFRHIFLPSRCLKYPQLDRPAKIFQTGIFNTLIGRQTL
jgi:hypothetical protein